MQIPDRLPFISVIIPTLNEETSIGLVLADIPADWVGEVVVVNNGSTDRTPEIARNLGAKVVDEPQRGYGKACLTGIASLDERAEIVVFLDGDYSDHPYELPSLVMPILTGKADLVIGSRTLGNAAPESLLPQARYGNVLACFLMRLTTGHTFSDLGPFRAIGRKSLERIGMTDVNFGWTVEMQIKAVRFGLNCLDVPVSYRKRVGVSKISGTVSGAIKAGWKILYTIAKYAK